MVEAKLEQRRRHEDAENGQGRRPRQSSKETGEEKQVEHDRDDQVCLVSGQIRQDGEAAPQQDEHHREETSIAKKPLALLDDQFAQTESVIAK